MGTEVPKVRGSTAYDHNQMLTETAGWMSAIGETQKLNPLLGGGTLSSTHPFKRGFFVVNRECPAQTAAEGLSFTPGFFSCALPAVWGKQQAVAGFGTIGLDLANRNECNDFARQVSAIADGLQNHM